MRSLHFDVVRLMQYVQTKFFVLTSYGRIPPTVVLNENVHGIETPQQSAQITRLKLRACLHQR